MPLSGPGVGARGHAKTVEAMKWMKQNHGDGSYYVPAHLERAGPFNPDGNNGFNIEHLRDFNNAAPRIAFGMETQPGHGASDARGEYTIRRNGINGVNVDSVGGTTYGGTGVYGAQIGGVWDALLGEGRNWWFFASSDWHNRGMFGPDDRRSSQDFYPGEYQRDFVMVRDRDGRGHSKARDVLTPQEIVDGLRTGNSFASSGQLIDRLAFVACADTKLNDWLGNLLLETSTFLAAANNTDVELRQLRDHGREAGGEAGPGSRDRDRGARSFRHELLAVHVPESVAGAGRHHPAAQQAGARSHRRDPRPGQRLQDAGHAGLLGPVAERLDHEPEHGQRSGRRQEHDGCSGPHVRQRQLEAGRRAVQGDDVPHSARQRFAVRAPARLEPAGPGAVRDRRRRQPAAGSGYQRGPRQSDGQRRHRRPCPTNANLRIPCASVGTTDFDGCPSHLPVVNGQKMVAFDVAAWSDLWFYSNPIYIEVKGGTRVAGVN